MTGDYSERQDFIPTRSIQWDSSWPELDGEGERQILVSYMKDRFGIPENLFDGHLFLKRKKGWFLLKDSPHIKTACRLKVSVAGIKAFRRVGNFIKPTTRIIQLFGCFATKAILKINNQQLQRLLTRQAILVDLEIEDGYVILMFDDQPLGLGLLVNKTLHSQLPRKELLFHIRME